jgi:hypothetical protein
VRWLAKEDAPGKLSSSLGYSASPPNRVQQLTTLHGP